MKKGSRFLPERIFNYILMIKKQPPTLAEQQSNINYLSEKHVTSFEIHIELKAFDFCKERIFSFSLN